MTKRKTLLSSLVLTLVLFLNTIPAAYADSDRLTMTVSDGEVVHGDSVTVTVSASRELSIRGAGITIAYDSAALKPATNSLQEGFRIDGPMKVGKDTVLRISSFPGAAGTVKTNKPLAELTFQTVAPGENIFVDMTAVYLYDRNLQQIPITKADPVSIRAEAIPVTSITLDMETLNLETEESKTLKATVLPENTSYPAITWTSSDERVVTVKDGVLLGIAPGKAVITATAGGYSAECTVTVADPPRAGYVLEMPLEQELLLDQKVTISPFITNADVGVYNAYDITIAYDPTMLLLPTTEIEGTSVTAVEGSLNVIRYGADQKVGTEPFSLTFYPKKPGETTVSVTSARIDHSQNAVISNVAKAHLDPGKTRIIIGGYSVSLPPEFTGETVAQPNTAYTFEAVDKYYDYTFEGSTVGGQPMSVKDNGDGTFTVEKVTGTLVIDTQKTGKTFDVYLGTDMTGNGEARYMEDYSATIHEDDYHLYEISVSIGGVAYNQYEKRGNIYTIHGEHITGDIVFAVKKTVPPAVTYYDVTFEGTGAGAAEGNAASVAAGSTYSFRLNKKEEGYRYSVSYRIGEGTAETIRPGEDGTYRTKKVTGDLTITVNKEADVQDYQVEVSTYITLNDRKTMYLVRVTGAVDDSKVFTYAGTPMYYSKGYQAWCFLTVETEELTQELAAAQVKTQPGVANEIGRAVYDVNMQKSVNINDAQLVYDMYKGKYADFKKIDMQRFLNADVDADGKVMVDDAAAVVHAIK